MGRALRAIQMHDLATLFRIFGVDAEPDLVAVHQAEIQDRFVLEAQEIARLCGGLREQERFKLLREALRLAYERALLHASAAAHA